MLTKLDIKLTSEDFTRLLATCMVIPAYMDFFISKEPLFQIIGYLAYLVPIGVLILNKEITISTNFLLYWCIFSILLIVPSIINLSSGRLESDLINLKALFSKWIFLSAMLFCFNIWIKKYQQLQWDSLVCFLTLFMLPMIGIIFFKILFEIIQCEPSLIQIIADGSCRVIPFSVAGPFITSELFLLFILLCLAKKANFLKATLIVLSFLAIIFLQTRSAMLATIIAVTIFYGIPLANQLSKKLKLLLIPLAMLLGYFLFMYLVDNSFLGRDIVSMTGRLHMWELGIESIKSSPWIGIGFDVTPNFYSFIYNHWDNTIHNMFIRIATENGLPLLILILITLILAIYNSFIRQDLWTIACIVSIIVYHFFSTRHISINLANIFLYLILMRAFIPLKIKNKMP